MSTVQAAGGLVWRDGRILLVHRPRYDDWSFPKGKLDPGERHEQAALREVEEETGVRCRLGDPAGTTTYVDSRHRPKVVRYWHLTPLEDPGFAPNNEVDEIRWCRVADALRLLSYVHDRELLDEQLLDGQIPSPEER